MKPTINETQLLNDLKTIILESKNRVIQSANSILTMMYWEIGNTINQEILKNSRADYGKSIVVTLSQQLQYDIFCTGKKDEQIEYAKFTHYKKRYLNAPVST